MITTGVRGSRSMSPEDGSISTPLRLLVTCKPVSRHYKGQKHFSDWSEDKWAIKTVDTARKRSKQSSVNFINRDEEKNVC